MSKKRKPAEVSEEELPVRRRYTEEFKAEAVQMLLDGHAAGSVCQRLGLSGANLLYVWKRQFLVQGARRRWVWRRWCGSWRLAAQALQAGCRE